MRTTCGSHCLRLLKAGRIASGHIGELQRAGHGSRTIPLVHTLYLVTSGTGDPTRASIPLHLAVNGSIEIGGTVGVVLAGDAAELVKADVREQLEGVGLPPMRELFAKARQHEVPVFV